MVDPYYKMNHYQFNQVSDGGYELTLGTNLSRHLSQWFCQHASGNPKPTKTDGFSRETDRFGGSLGYENPEMPKLKASPSFIAHMAVSFDCPVLGWLHSSPCCRCRACREIAIPTRLGW